MCLLRQNGSFAALLTSIYITTHKLSSRTSVAAGVQMVAPGCWRSQCVRTALWCRRCAWRAEVTPKRAPRRSSALT